MRGGNRKENKIREDVKFGFRDSKIICYGRRGQQFDRVLLGYAEDTIYDLIKADLVVKGEK